MAKPNLNEKWITDREISEPENYGEQFLTAMSKARYGDISHLSKDEVGTVLKIAGLAAAASIAVAGAPYAQKVVDDAGENIDHIYNELTNSGSLVKAMPGYMLAEMMLEDAMKTGNTANAGKAKTTTSKGTADSVKKAAPPIIGTLAAASSGCVEDIEDVKKYVKDPVDEISVFVYEEGLNKVGDPQDVINNEGLYALVTEESGGDEKSGIPILKPVREYVIQTDLDTEEIIIHDAQGNLVDKSDIPKNWKELIVKDKYGMPIADALGLLHIDEVGNNKYEINGLAQEMQDPDGEHIWRMNYDFRDYPGITRFNDNIFKNGDGIDDMFGGFVKGEDGKAFGVLLADEDVFRLYGGKFGFNDGEHGAVPITQSMCMKVPNEEMYIHMFDLSELPEDTALIESAYPAKDHDDIKAKNNGLAILRFKKEKL